MTDVRMSIHKAIVALIGAGVSLASILMPSYAPELADILSADKIAAVATLITPFLVWWIPNKPLEPAP